MTRWVLCVAAVSSLLACAPGLQKLPDGSFTLHGPDYRITPLPGGALMPAGWKLTNYKNDDGKLTRSDLYDQSDFTFQRESDRARLTLTSEEIPAGSLGLTLSQLVAARPHDLEVLGDRPSTEHALALEKRALHETVLAERPSNVAGREGYEVVSELRYADTGEFRSRKYGYWFRPGARKWLSALIYEAPPDTFSTGTKDASDLV